MLSDKRIRELCGVAFAHRLETNSATTRRFYEDLDRALWELLSRRIDARQGMTTLPISEEGEYVKN